MASKKDFNENTRVQVPAAIHLVRLGYTYLNDIAESQYDPWTNILSDVFIRSLMRLNPEIDELQAQNILKGAILSCRNDDLGREFYGKLVSETGLKFIDFNNPNNNEWHATTEFSCENPDTKDVFRPDITIFVNGLPLVFIEVKKPHNHEGMKAELDRINTRMRNKAFRSFFNITQFMIFSNNEEYLIENRQPRSGAFYATTSRSGAFFNAFREADKDLLSKVEFNVDVPENTIKQILIHRNCPQLPALPEFQTNQQPTTPTNRILTSMLSKERLLFLLRYGIAYVEMTKENDKGEKITELQKHIMRYQQFFATKAIRRTLDSGLRSGIIWHTQGSGKTALAYYNVKSLTHYYASKHMPVKFYFIVDRLDLLEQATSEFAARGLIVRNAQSREELMSDFQDNTVVKNAEGKPEIMVVNIQKFATDHQRISKKQVYNTNLIRVFFIDEAHRGYSPQGCFLANLFEADKESIKIALTGTPLLRAERESWRVFGDYIDKYYYDKSISDGYTLRLMREDVETIYKQRIADIIEKLTADVEVRKKDIDHDTIIEHEKYINGLLDYIIHDLRRSRIQQDAPHMGGMIVCETNPQARRLKEILDARMKDDPKPLRSILILHDEGDKLERKEQIDEFKKTENVDILIVNAMLLTGFDAPRLKKLYLCRKLDGHNLLQALTRVNRPYRDFKYGYVVDFANIKENFIETNNLYMRELNRTDGDDENVSGSDTGAGDILMASNDEIVAQMEEIRDKLFQYDTDNAEGFSRQIGDIKDKEELYELRKVLENAKALINQVRSFGDDDLQQRFERLQIDSIPVMIKEVNHRIERINLLADDDHKADVSAIIREALSMMEFEFKFRDKEELEIVYNDLLDRYENVEREFSANFDQQDDEFISLSEAFRAYFARRGFTPATVAEAREDIGYMDSVMQKIKEINRKNNILRSKYKGDEKFVRIHKRVEEENERRQAQTPKLHVLISPREVDIVVGLRAVKETIDDRLLYDVHILQNEGFFQQLTMQGVSTELQRLEIEAQREDRVWLRNHIATEYLQSYAYQ